MGLGSVIVLVTTSTFSLVAIHFNFIFKSILRLIVRLQTEFVVNLNKDKLFQFKVIVLGHCFYLQSIFIYIVSNGQFIAKGLSYAPQRNYNQ